MSGVGGGKRATVLLPFSITLSDYQSSAKEEIMQKLTISGFLGINQAEVILEGVTIIIGPQASGKSIIARLFFFFNEYFADFDELPLIKNEHKKTYDSKKKDDFYKIFPQYAWLDDSFSIIYENGDHSITVKSSRGSSSLEIMTSASVAQSFRQLKTEYQKYAESFPAESRLSGVRLLREFRNQMAHNSLTHFEHSLFVPAARSFYATIREEIFAILSMDEKIDRIIMQFGDFYETAKSRLALENEHRSRNSMAGRHREYFEKIAKGRYVRIDGRDWIEMDRGRIEMSKASSGQQEAFPLLVALSQFPAPGRTLIIEEPEAHLFPSSQITMLDFIVRQSVARQTSIFITTHSPYLLGALNNLILRSFNADAWPLGPLSVAAFSLQSGGAQSILDIETGLISADYIDAASDEIYSEFAALIEMSAARPSGDGDLE